MAINLNDHPTQSLLYKAAFTAASNPRRKQPVKDEVLYTRYRVQDIMQAMQKLGPQGVSFEQLKQFPQASLDSLHAEILGFFMQDPGYFNRFARIHPPFDRLSVHDFQAAGQLAQSMRPSAQAALSDILTNRPVQLNSQALAPSEDQVSLNRLPGSITTRGEVPRRLPSIPGGANTLGTAVSPSVSPASDKSTPVIASASSVMAQPVDRSIQNPDLTIPSTNSGTPGIKNSEPSELTKALVGRSLVAEQMRGPILLWQPTPADPALTPADAPMRSVFHPDTPFEQVDYNESWKLSAHALADLLTRIDPSGEVTLAALRAYKPQSRDDIALLSHLRQMDVFQALAQLDAVHENTLDMDDVRIMADRHLLILADAHLSVFIGD